MRMVNIAAAIGGIIVAVLVVAELGHWAWVWREIRRGG